MRVNAGLLKEVGKQQKKDASTTRCITNRSIPSTDCAGLHFGTVN